MKFLVLMGVLLVAWLVWRSRRSRPGPPASGATPTPPRAPSAPQDMVRCEMCGLHLPRADALADGRGRHFCGPEHRDQAR